MNASPSAQRGLILLEQRRYSDAEKYFRESLAAQPDDAFAMYHLALCELNQQRPKDALPTIERALSMEPGVATFHALRAITLVRLDRGKEALAASDEAVRIDPDSDFAFTARASVFLAGSDWPAAEEAARRALEINPENSNAASQLAHALRLQNRLGESADQTRYMLARDPDDPDNHNAAGWLALQQGDHRRAQEHFLEALRLDAGNKAARSGLKEAFKARSVLYRGYLQYCFFMQRFTTGKRWLIVLGVFLAVQFVRVLMPGPAGLAVVAVYFLLVLWTHVARPVGNLQLLGDRFARQALTAGEKWEAWFAGGGVVLGVPLVLAGLFTGIPSLFVTGLALIGAAFPLAYTFTNESRSGRIVFGAAGALVYAAGAICLLAPLLGARADDVTMTAATVAAVIVVAATYASNIPALRRPSQGKPSCLERRSGLY